MAYDTKVILKLVARYIARSENLKEAYEAVCDAASVEGVSLPSYEDMVKKIQSERS